MEQSFDVLRTIDDKRREVRSLGRGSSAATDSCGRRSNLDEVGYPCRSNRPARLNAFVEGPVQQQAD